MLEYVFPLKSWCAIDSEMQLKISFCSKLEMSLRNLKSPHFNRGEIDFSTQSQTSLNLVLKC